MFVRFAPLLLGFILGFFCVGVGGGIVVTKIFSRSGIGTTFKRVTPRREPRQFQRRNRRRMFDRVVTECSDDRKEREA